MPAFDGLILKQIPFKESSKILHVYTAEGMKSVLVHGAKKFGSPYLSSSENLNLVRFQAVGKDMLTLTDADLIEESPHLRRVRQRDERHPDVGEHQHHGELAVRGGRRGRPGIRGGIFR